MMAYIDPDGREAHQRAVVESLGTVARLLASPPASGIAMSFAANAAGMHFYRALADCRQLIALEDEAPAAVVPASEAIAA